MIFRTFVPIVVMSFAIAGCTATPPNIAVAQKWTDAIARYNLVPIYPMQEDVQIGDVFLYAPPAGGDRHGSQPATWLNRIARPSRGALLSAMRQEYCDRFRLAPEPPDPGATTAPTVPAAAPAAVTVENTTSVQGVSTTQKVSMPAAAKPPTPPKAPVATVAARGGRTPPAVKIGDKCGALPDTIDATATFPPDVGAVGAAADLRLNRIELPEVSVASVTEAELAAAIPIDAFFGKIGLGTSSDAALDIKLTGIGELHLPYNRVFTLFEANKPEFATTLFTPGMFLSYINQKRPDLLPAACIVDLTALNDSRLTVIVANQVVYAQGIDYGYKSSSTVAGQLGASLAGAGAASKPGGTGSTTVANSPGAMVGGSDARTAFEAESARVAALTASLTGAGGTLQAGLGRSGNLTLKDTFKQPLAFGIGNLLEFAPSDLLQLYRRVYQGPDQAAERQDLDAYYGLFCGRYGTPPGRITLADYIELPASADVDGPAKLPSVTRRFRPFEGLPEP